MFYSFQPILYVQKGSPDPSFLYNKVIQYKKEKKSSIFFQYDIFLSSKHVMCKYVFLFLLFISWKSYFTLHHRAS